MKIPKYQADPQHAPGTLTAFDLEGNQKWQVTTPRPPNNAPGVGKIVGWDGLSVVMPICQQVVIGSTCDVHAYDANTGGLRWSFNGPTQTGLYQAGDFEGTFERVLSGVRPACLPNGWSAPSIAADGTVFIGNEEGPVYALRDVDADGRVQGEDEVSFYDTKAAFSGTATPAIAPNMLAVASCDTLFVFKGWSFEGKAAKAHERVCECRPKGQEDLPAECKSYCWLQDEVHLSCWQLWHCSIYIIKREMHMYTYSCHIYWLKDWHRIHRMT